MKKPDVPKPVNPSYWTDVVVPEGWINVCDETARGGRSDNPSARNFLYNTQAIRVQRCMAVGQGGNVRKRKQQWTTNIEDLSRPLKKCQQTLFK